MRTASILPPLLLAASIAAVGLVERRLATRQPAEGSGLLLRGAQVETHGKSQARFSAQIVEAGPHGRVARTVSGQVAVSSGKFSFSTDTLRMLDGGLFFEGNVRLEKEGVMFSSETAMLDHQTGKLSGKPALIRTAYGELRSQSFSLSKEDGLILENAVRAELRL